MELDGASEIMLNVFQAPQDPRSLRTVISLVQALLITEGTRGRTAGSVHLRRRAGSVRYSDIKGATASLGQRPAVFSTLSFTSLGKLVLF